MYRKFDYLNQTVRTRDVIYNFEILWQYNLGKISYIAMMFHEFAEIAKFNLKLQK